MTAPNLPRATSRRRLVTAIGTGLAAGLAGCSISDDPATATPTGVAPSRLRIRVVNETDSAREVSVSLTSITPEADRYEFFAVTGVEPGATRTTDPRELPAGRYELELEFDLGGATIRWTGRDCADKLVVVRYTSDGVVVSDRCESE